MVQADSKFWLAGSHADHIWLDTQLYSVWVPHETIGGSRWKVRQGEQELSDQIALFYVYLQDNSAIDEKRMHNLTNGDAEPKNVSPQVCNQACLC